MSCENVYKTFTHKWNTPDSSHWVRSYDNHLLCTMSHTNLLPTVDYLCFLFVASSSKNMKAFLMFEKTCFPRICWCGRRHDTGVTAPRHSLTPTSHTFPRGRLLSSITILLYPMTSSPVTPIQDNTQTHSSSTLRTRLVRSVGMNEESDTDAWTRLKRRWVMSEEEWAVRERETSLSFIKITQSLIY